MSVVEERLSKIEAQLAALHAGPPLAFSIKQFCDLHDLSVSQYYVLRKQGLAPREMALGARRVISIEEAARWRAERTAASQISNNAA